MASCRQSSILLLNNDKFPLNAFWETLKDRYRAFRFSIGRLSSRIALIFEDPYRWKQLNGAKFKGLSVQSHTGMQIAKSGVMAALAGVRCNTPRHSCPGSKEFLQGIS
jgi:hypothetical protein